MFLKDRKGARKSLQLEAASARHSLSEYTPVQSLEDNGSKSTLRKLAAQQLELDAIPCPSWEETRWLNPTPLCWKNSCNETISLQAAPWKLRARMVCQHHTSFCSRFTSLRSAAGSRRRNSHDHGVPQQSKCALQYHGHERPELA